MSRNTRTFALSPKTVWIASVLGITVWACANPLQPSVREVAGLRMALEVFPDSASNGDTVQVRATLRNITEDTVSLSSGVGCLAQVTVRGNIDAYHSFSGISSGGCIASIGSWHIPPSDSLVQEWHIGIGVYAVEVPAGEYAVSVSFTPVPNLGTLEHSLFID